MTKWIPLPFRYKLSWLVGIWLELQEVTCNRCSSPCYAIESSLLSTVYFPFLFHSVPLNPNPDSNWILFFLHISPLHISLNIPLSIPRWLSACFRVVKNEECNVTRLDGPDNSSVKKTALKKYIVLVRA